jgi:hypothetical protein
LLSKRNLYSLYTQALRQEDAAAAMEKTTEEGAAAPLTPPGAELVALEEYLLGLPEWKDLNSEALNTRAAAASSAGGCTS